MASQIEIINVALIRIGANPITSLTEGTTEQIVSVSAWDIVRQECLRQHPWNFAIADIELNQVSAYTAFEFQYAYQLPTDCLRLLEVYEMPDYKLQGHRILTDQAVCKIKYVADVTDTTEWDASFVDVMAQRLAQEVAYALTKSQATADSMYQIYQQKLRVAKFVDATEDIQDPLGGYESTLLNVRY